MAEATIDKKRPVCLEFPCAGHALPLPGNVRTFHRAGGAFRFLFQRLLSSLQQEHRTAPDGRSSAGVS